MSNKLNREDFSIVEENKEDHTLTVIKRSNVETTFTVKLVEDHRKQLDKAKREIEAQRGVANATCENIERNHEWIKELDDERLHHASMYYQNKDIVRQADEKLPEINDQIAQYDELLELVYELGGFVKSEVKETGNDNKKKTTGRESRSAE